MGTIFKYNNLPIQCLDLKKKIKKMKVSEDDIEIIIDDIPNDILENIFVAYMKCKKSLEDKGIEFQESPCFIWNGLEKKECKVLCINSILKGESLLKPFWFKSGFKIIGNIPDRFIDTVQENGIRFDGIEEDDDIIDIPLEEMIPYFLWNQSFDKDACRVSGTGYTRSFNPDSFEIPEWFEGYIIVKGEPIFPLEQDENTGLPKVKAYESN